MKSAISDQLLDLTLREILALAPAAKIGLPRIGDAPRKFDTRLSVDPIAIFGTPRREVLRINIDEEDGISLALMESLGCLRDTVSLWPGKRHIFAILADREKGIVIFLPTMGDANGHNDDPLDCENAE